MFFKLKPNVGDHNEKGVDYTNGDIIETDSNLAEKWPLKFDQCDGVESPQPKKDRTLGRHVSEQDVERTPEDAGDTPDDSDKASTGMNVDSVEDTPEDADDEPVDDQRLDVLRKINSKLGDNVTDEYPTAVGIDLVILQRGKKFRAADHEMPNHPLHKSKTRDEMLAWLEEEGK